MVPQDININDFLLDTTLLLAEMSNNEHVIM
jgi:hypothetical protein